jgi:hypothetical protein
VGVAAKDPFYTGDALITKQWKDGRTALKEVGVIINSDHVPAAFSHQGEGACIAENIEDNVLAHILIIHLIVDGFNF